MACALPIARTSKSSTNSLGATWSLLNLQSRGLMSSAETTLLQGNPWGMMSWRLLGRPNPKARAFRTSTASWKRKYALANCLGKPATYATKSAVGLPSMS